MYFLDFPGPEQTGADLAVCTPRRTASTRSQPRPQDDRTGREPRSGMLPPLRILDVPLDRRRPQRRARSLSPPPRPCERLRAWANGRCLSADRPGLYQTRQPREGRCGKAARKIERPTTRK